MFKKVSLYFALLLLAIFIIPIIPFTYFLKEAQKNVRRSRPYDQSPVPATSKVLVLGDSTAVGTGASHSIDSVAGRLGKDFPTVTIVNKSRNGLTSTELLNDMPDILEDHYDLIIIQIGGNDILRLVPLEETKNNIQVIINQAQRHTLKIILYTTGDVGATRMLPWYVRPIMTARSKYVRNLGLELSQKRDNLIYIDLYTVEKQTSFVNNPKLYYSTDMLHPSSTGYGMWYDQLSRALKKFEYKLK